MTKFHRNRSTLKGRSAGQRHTHKPVGFYGQIAPPVPNTPSSEFPQFGMPAEYMSCHVVSCQRRRKIPLRPIWTIMVAAKLDQSRVLVIKFRQNRLTLKGRSASRRHTDRQTDRQTHRETSRLVFTARLRPQVRMPPVRNARRIHVMSCDMYVISCHVMSKSSRGHSAADLDHYGRGQTRSE